MCEAIAYLAKDGHEKVVMESVGIVKPEEDGIYLENIFGEPLKIKACIQEMNLVNHKNFFETLGD